MDVLSDVLALLKPRSHMYGGFDFGGELSVQFGQHRGMKCYAVTEGSCYLTVEGEEPVLLTAGDWMLLPRGRPFELASSLGLPPTSFYDLLPKERVNGSIVTIAGGGTVCIAGGYFLLEGHHADTLLNGLPPLIHIREESTQAALRWSIERIMQELREPRPGSELVTQQLTMMMLIEALRVFLAEGPTSDGWLFALNDKQIGAAIHAMHEDPAQRWTVQTLAAKAYMSRSTFAEKFKLMVGSSPLEYLTQWRMMLASERLTSSGDSVATIALSLGYESESAFSTAFKRVMGCSPRQFHRERGSGSLAVITLP